MCTFESDLENPVTMFTFESDLKNPAGIDTFIYTNTEIAFKPTDTFTSRCLYLLEEYSVFCLQNT